MTTMSTISGLNDTACSLAPSGSGLPLPSLPADFATDLLAKLWSGGTLTVCDHPLGNNVEFHRPKWAEAISIFGVIFGQGLFMIFNVVLFKSLREELPSRVIILEEAAEKQKLREKLIRELKDACPYCKFNLKSGKDTCAECGKVFFKPTQEM
jgi:hypothetical protein